jgi:hypothetical protein
VIHSNAPLILDIIFNAIIKVIPGVTLDVAASAAAILEAGL